MTIREQLGNIVLQSLTEISRKKEDINMADIGHVLEHIYRQMDGVSNENHNSLLGEVRQLAEFLERTKQEIIYAGNNGSPNLSASDATQHLEAIIQNTEEAGHKIMDAVSAIGEVAARIGGEAEKEIASNITSIYEACNFQDLTTQRINKVIKILASVSDRVDNMLKLFGVEASIETRQQQDTLLNGPQLPGKAPSQSDVDNLFSDL